MSEEEYYKGKETTRAHFTIDVESWDKLSYNITTSRSKFLRDCIYRIIDSETELDVLYKRMVRKRKELHLLEIEIEELKDRIEELEKAKVKRDIKVI
ncbi:hypothetical protein [uncultured Methanobrevibacter sp.]|uniref:hypothetical protein n=1 Tax=uncultured Methanobrevibacter sp. TaxID=253161 RepID=UPI0025ECEC69|nr:hypothetical protein [uncultured Methanobrevibacter sp.]